MFSSAFPPFFFFCIALTSFELLSDLLKCAPRRWGVRGVHFSRSFDVRLVDGGWGHEREHRQQHRRVHKRAVAANGVRRPSYTRRATLQHSSACAPTAHRGSTYSVPSSCPWFVFRCAKISKCALSLQTLFLLFF